MSNAKSLRVLGNKDLLGYILQFIVRPKHYAEEITDWLPLYTLSSLTRACRRTRQLLSSHSDLQCARRVYDEAHICEHQPVHPSDPCDMCAEVPFECNAGMSVYAPDRRGGYAGSDVKAPLRMKCICKCHNYECPFCIGALKAGFSVPTSVEGWALDPSACVAFQRHQYAFFIEGNFVVSSYFLGRFAQRTGVSIAGTHCPSWDVFARGHGPFLVIPQMRMFSHKFEDEGYWIAVALLSGDAALLTFMVSGDEDGSVTSIGLLLYLKMIGRIRPAKEDIHPGRIWNIEKRGHEHHKQTAPWPYPEMRVRSKANALSHLANWELKIREKLVRVERVESQLAVLNTLVCANPALRKGIWTRNASISIMCGDPTLSAECKVEIIVKTCILKYGWFNPQVIVNYMATKIVDEQLSSRDIPFDAMLSALGDKVVYTNQIEQALIYSDGAENLYRPPRTGSLYE